MSDYHPKISVILPSLNVEPFIEECIESVINQTLENIEIICVDAGSDDGTLEILEKHASKDSRIKILNSEEKSYGHQMNLGISVAKGEYIGIVETDDYIDKKMYETLYNLTNGGSADISKVSFYHVHDYDEDNIRFVPNNSKANSPKKEFTIYDDVNIIAGHPSIWAAIYRRNFLIDNNISFIEAPGGGWVDNPFLFETLLLAKKITFKNEHCYYYREFNPNSSTNLMKDLTLPMRRMLDNLDVLESYSCDDKNIFSALYVHIFWHIHETLNKKNYSDEKEKVDNYIRKVVNRLDESIIINKFSLKDQKVYYQFLDNSNFEDTINIFNSKIKGLIDMGNFKELSKINNKKISLIFLRYSHTNLEFKEDFYKIIKEDFVRIFNHLFYEEFILSLNKSNSALFKAVIQSMSFEEFDVIHDNLKLIKENKKLSKNNKKLKDNIKNSKKLSKTIINSKSWKVSKPLRFIKRLI